jgi:queuine tRNA-ribosyltransferase
MISFCPVKTDGKARAGLLRTDHGDVDTPAFMPVGTAGTVKGITPDQLAAAGVQMVLANTYHLMLRPGAETIARLGGLHRVMGWAGPILTDSGGYQVFSLARLRQVDDEGIVFQSHIDGSELRLSPGGAVQAQRLLGADMITQLDECPSAEASRDQVAQAVRRSTAWARVCRDEWDKPGQEGPSRRQALFGIQQGGVFADLRGQSAASLVELDLPGYAIGGLSVGEGHVAMCQVLDRIDGQFPPDRPRYLMGVGEPRDIAAAVARGVDLFDCVLPTRNGRNAQAFTSAGRVHMRNARWRKDPSPLEPDCDCYTCRNFSRGVLRHLFLAKEMLGPILVSIHNLRFYTRFMARIREAIAERNLAAWSEQVLAGTCCNARSDDAQPCTE